VEWLVFFSIFPLINIAGISITFYIFMIIAYIFTKNQKKLFKISTYVDLVLIMFLIFVGIGAVFSEESFRDRSPISIGVLMMQYVYWVIVALYVKTWIYEYDFYKLSRVVFWAAAVSSFYYAFLNSSYLVFSPNAFAYTIVVALPIGFYYVMRRYSFWLAALIGVGLVMAVLYSGSRTGTLLVGIELLLILSLSSKKFKITSLLFGAVLLPFILLSETLIEYEDMVSFKYEMADILEDYSPKIAHTLRMEENVMERDKSWLIRELMIQKGELIFEEHPFFGVGLGNFMFYRADLDIAKVSAQWLHENEDNYNTRSSQNSYLLILAEDGIFALISIVIVFFIILWNGFYYLWRFRNTAEIYIYIPFIALLFYGVILVTVQGAMFWILLGLAMTLTQHKRHLR